MTSKEKIDKAWELVNSKHIETNDEIQLVRFAVRTARELVERDIPMKPIVFNYEEHRLNHIECQNGCKPFKDKEYKFCPYCGQRLDWE